MWYSQVSKRFLIGLLASAVLGASAYWAVSAWEREFLDTKSVRTGSGIVVRKEHVVFTSDNHKYTNDSGIELTREVGSEECRLYFRVVDFGPYSEAKAAILMRAEQRRSESGNLRYAIVGRRLFDETVVGDVLRFHNQYVGGDDAMTWGAENIRCPDVR